MKLSEVNGRLLYTGFPAKTSGADYKLSTVDWSAAKVFITDIDKYKYAFISDLIPEKPVKTGSMVFAFRSNSRAVY